MTREQYKSQIMADLLKYVEQVEITFATLAENYGNEILTEKKNFSKGNLFNNDDDALCQTRDALLDMLRTNDGGCVTGDTGNGYYYQKDDDANKALIEGAYDESGYSNGWAVVKEALTEGDMLEELDPCEPCRMDAIARSYLLQEVMDEISNFTLYQTLNK